MLPNECSLPHSLDNILPKDIFFNNHIDATFHIPSHGMFHMGMFKIFDGNYWKISKGRESSDSESNNSVSSDTSCERMKAIDSRFDLISRVFNNTGSSN